jgi:putative phosphoesterase
LLDVAALRLAERERGDEPAGLGRVVVLDGRLEVLPDRGRLAKLAPEPAKEAHLRRFHARSLARVGRDREDAPVATVAVISDTHLPRGGRTLSTACLEVLAAADLILHAGDVTAASVLELLTELAPVDAVHGNVDEPALQASLPSELVVEVEDVRIGMVHDGGSAQGRHARLVGRFPGCHAVVYGHTHMPELIRHDGVWILNPGSPTERRRAPHRSLIVLEVDGGTVSPRLVTLP